MIKIATENINQKRCFDYLVEKGTVPSTDLYIYIEENGEIIGVAGLMVGQGLTHKLGFIEPLQTNKNVYTLYLYGWAEAYMKLNGCSYVMLGTNKANVQNLIEKHLGATFWGENINQFMKAI